MTQALFALNERYVINEKGSIAAAASLPYAPVNFEATVQYTLAYFGKSPVRLESSVEKFERVLETVENLCANQCLRRER